ncbi:MAG: LicD family protein [Bacilli bacterium]|nr:LicD family protein [Bacilli bacterium]MDD4521306.1 LicD family protein [Bacilli bacterium]
MQNKNQTLPDTNYIIDNTVYPIGKDSDGVMNTTKELHEVILSIVLEFDRVCRKNNIPYALGFGSALGIHNYQGFIPWDDDADIVFMYEDIERLVAALKRDLDPRFAFDAYETDPRYNVLIPTMKITRVDTYLKEKNWLTLPNKCRKHAGVFVDICAFIGVPENAKEHYKLIKKTKRVMPWYVFIDGILRLQPYRLKKKIKRFEEQVAKQYQSSSSVSQTIIIPWQDWSRDVDRLAFPRKVILPFREYTFEGHRVYSFNNIEEFVRLRYGEKALRKIEDGKWYDPYPLERRKAGHIAAYNLKRAK